MERPPAQLRWPACLLCASLSALTGASALAALPPASSGTAAPAAPAASGSGLSLPTLRAADEDDDGWRFPPVRLGGTLGFDWRHESGEGRKVLQRGTIGTVTATTETYVWEPWFARLGGKLGLSVARNSFSGNGEGVVNNNVSHSTGISGSANLRVLPTSRFPFHGYWSRNDNRFSSELLSTGSYVGQRLGFEQTFGRIGGDLAVSFDRNTQESDSAGKTSQDTLQLRVSENRDPHRINANANLARNRHARSNEHSTQKNVTVQHQYTPSLHASLDSLLNVSQSDFRLVGAVSGAQLMQASTTMFWRPEEHPLTLNAGVRVLAASADARNLETGDGSDSELRNLNLNLGLQYELNRHTRVVASSNASHTDSNGLRASSTSHNGAIQYTPDARKIGSFDYSWNAGAGASAQTGGENASSQLSLHLQHRLSRSFALAGGAGLSAEASQGLSMSNSTLDRPGDPRRKRYLTHGASLSWSKSVEGTHSVVRLSFSDNRALDSRGDYFQMFNLQASSNVPTGSHTSWSGSLTVQGTRQGSSRVGGPGAYWDQRGGDFAITSSGSLSYRNQRAFGVRGLRYTSDLRLTGEALLPLLGGPQDQELAAWENRLDYGIGRLNLRMATLLSHVRAPASGLAPGSLVRESRVHRAVMFSVSRAFGD